ncbi:OLC1v1011397C1 [Oldenlandia corymbosa var. corymbosa]|uniref:OLC1v1011397C1 n=1 Tax=Oldenlandia corymbosa var. corymbosa TaxID=529605 RepID=A0AAV1DWR1_OLDCO|nr:OLC1v1011397C1 [Oldenlandia corymbosa var. corymbosa]
MATVGLPIWFTELDVVSNNEHIRADDLEVMLREVFAHPAVEGIILFGFWELNLFRENSHLVNAEGDLDEAGRRYLALKNEWLTRAHGHIDGHGQFSFRGFHGSYELEIISATINATTTFVVDKGNDPLWNYFLKKSPPLDWIPQGPSLCSFFSTLSFPFSSTQNLLRRHLDEESGDNDELSGPPKLFVVQPRFRPEPVLQSKLDEALNLANSLEQQRNGYYATEFSDKELPPHMIVQNPLHRAPSADTYFRKGTVDLVKCHLNAVDTEDEVDAVFVNASLTGIQQRNLERIWGKPVLDRVSLIIEIFNAHAQTKEAKLQAELAALMYKRSRLVRIRGPGGRHTFGSSAEVVSARGRGSGGRGFISGAGETELQLQRRRILERRNQLLAEIKEVRRTRAVQRAARKRDGRSAESATIAVVGYTNAGKSTLVSKLSNSQLYCDDRLFATVDPKLRSVCLPSGRKVLLSDTVGFISDLPVQLVEAFKATLEEVVEADLLVHVLDSSSPNVAEQRDSVLQVLHQIGVSNDKLENMIEVWNKIDLQRTELGLDECGKDEEVRDLLDENDDESDQDVSALEVSDCENAVDQTSELSLNPEELEAEQADHSDGWLLSGEDEDLLVDDECSSTRQDSPDSTENSTFKNCTAMDNGSQYAATSQVQTSALTGVGLQELLEIIDNKLGRQREEVVERSIFFSKWRPPRSEDTMNS